MKFLPSASETPVPISVRFQDSLILFHYCFSLIWSEFVQISFLVHWFEITGKILQEVVSPSSALKYNLFR